MFVRYDDEHWPLNEAEMDQYSADLKSFRKRTKKVVMLIMSLVSKDIATVLEQFERDPKSMWNYLKDEYDKITPDLRQHVKEKLNSFRVNEKLSVRDIQLEFLTIFRECTHQNYTVNKEDQVMTLFSGMARTKYGLLKRLYYRQKEAPGIDRIWAQMGVDELDDKKVLEYFG